MTRRLVKEYIVQGHRYWTGMELIFRPLGIRFTVKNLAIGDFLGDHQIWFSGEWWHVSAFDTPGEVIDYDPSRR